ncbi:MAG: 4-hydroxy-tetrahydrodipicolinate reductase [Spirochaetes bacterium GWF1_31_7]|nr:MAG: 4-hydroxy-tetrahydrodipicolinate reductase [Spirochaetes bacterium GWE1_32_154]OHD51179.1 MAG: 4-hydroxy-tetrahydrodipicolinate reductase [Spirochaetes bacterium GWE2_31_10]OHD52098.1 MAG: 4-hydroxy-tetrahydrodipicolinate reductase [Spirochaetes bacterium GWF1_31_7]
MKLLIIGPNGKMGKAIVQTAYKNKDITIVGGIAPSNRSYINSDLGYLCGIGTPINALVYDNINDIISKADLVVDCTMPDVSISVLKVCVEHNKAFITGTTGFNASEMEYIKESAECIPLLLAANTSKLTHIFYAQLINVCKSIKEYADIDIIDYHDNMKLDAPSGTAKEIARMIAKELNYDVNTCFEYGRNARKRRGKNTIAFNSIRSGGISGAIKVIFGFQDENIELSLNIFNMNTFAKGIVDGCLYLKNKGNGLYGIEEVFKI